MSSGAGLSEIKSIEQELEKFGLTSSQAKIYLLLVAHKELRIQEIAQLAKVPRSSVYQNLKVMYELGIAEEIVEENFKKVRPYPIGIIKHGLNDQLLNLQKLKEDLNELEKEIMVERPISFDKTVLHYYQGRSGARQLYWNTLKAATPIYVYSDWGRGRYVGMKFYEYFVAESRDRKIQERVLINPTPHAIESIRKYNLPGSAIARTRIEDVRAISLSDVFIKGDTLIYDNTFAQIYLKNLEINGFEIENSYFADSQRSIFETLWNAAQPIIELL